ncbi:MAG: SprT-like domain-containing protein [Planctomycetes bacterium]|nr:SprT-like domain-containing protein [Planctomycetota bacterium]
MDWGPPGLIAPGISQRWLQGHPHVEGLLDEWPPERIRQVLDAVLELWGCLDLTAAMEWSWNPRLRTTAGRAVFIDMLIELNPLLLARHPEEMEALLVHEAAHLVVQRLHGRQPPHGEIWKAYMRKAGHSTRATHELDVRGLRRKGRLTRHRRTGSKVEALLRKVLQGTRLR